MKIVKKSEIGYAKRHNSKPEKRKFFFENYEKDSIINVTETAKSLGVSRTIIYKWMNQINSEK